MLYTGVSFSVTDFQWEEDRDYPFENQSKKSPNLYKHSRNIARNTIWKKNLSLLQSKQESMFPTPAHCRNFLTMSVPQLKTNKRVAIAIVAFQLQVCTQ